MPIYCQSLSQYLEILCAWLGTAVPVPQDWVGLQSQSQASPSKCQGLQSQSLDPIAQNRSKSLKVTPKLAQIAQNLSKLLSNFY